MFFYKMCFFYYVGEFKNKNVRNFFEVLIGIIIVILLICILFIEYRYIVYLLYVWGFLFIIKYDFFLYNLYVYLKVNGMNNIVIKNKYEKY